MVRDAHGNIHNALGRFATKPENMRGISLDNYADHVQWYRRELRYREGPIDVTLQYLGPYMSWFGPHEFNDGKVFYTRRHLVVDVDLTVRAPYRRPNGGVSWIPFFSTKDYDVLRCGDDEHEDDDSEDNSGGFDRFLPYYDHLYHYRCYGTWTYRDMLDELDVIDDSIFGVWPVAPDGSWQLVEGDPEYRSSRGYSYGKRDMLRRAEDILKIAIPRALDQDDEYYSHWKEMHQYFQEQCAHDVVEIIGRMLDDYLPTIPACFRTLWNEYTTTFRGRGDVGAK